ncbi:MAG: hypothetical protein HQM02_10705, partial [Magnetococcales bacterium]|nr:hypothetical protein [Magnetococcales bacterium]
MPRLLVKESALSIMPCLRPENDVSRAGCGLGNDAANKPHSTDPGKKRRACLVDLFVAVSFLLFAITYQIGRIGGQEEIIDLSSDAGMHVACIAALDHPENFTADFFLKNERHCRLSTAMIYSSVVRFLVKSTESYSNAYIHLLGATVFCFLTGWYFFGVVLFRNRLL